MDDDTEELIERLCTRVGMIMEDACAAALAIRGLKTGARERSIADMEMAAERISALVAAAKALLNDG